MSAITSADLLKMKKDGKKITMLTAYDWSTAKFLDSCAVDIILAGDSLGNVALGYENTLPVTMEEMLICAKAVRRGVKDAMFLVDMPFMSFQISPEQAFFNAARFMKEAGADGVKVEGDAHIDAVKMMIDSGIPVMGHLGFTPQSVGVIGGYKVQGKDKRSADAIIRSAKALEKLGVFSLVLEMVPANLGKQVSKALKIPVISCGAGSGCDGQVVVTADLVGLYPKPAPKFVKRYADLGKAFKEAVHAFVWDVHSGKFPGKEQSF